MNPLKQNTQLNSAHVCFSFKSSPYPNAETVTLWERSVTQRDRPNAFWVTQSSCARELLKEL